MSKPETPPIQSFLARRVREGATSAQIAAVVAAAWQQIGTSMSPVIGLRGAAALYKRSLHLAAAAHPRLESIQAGTLSEPDIDALRAALSRQSSADAAAAGATLLLSFHGLVGSLIGPALSAQLLGDVWVKFSSGSAAQDPTP